MNQASCNRILDSIKQDDLVLFSALTEKSKNLLFGRFPLLSLCYLYNAKKIVSKFEDELLNVSNFNLVNENVEIYKKFKNVAGKSLRLYLNTNAVVSPLEMLAILHDDFKVKKVFTKVNLTTQMVENLTKIYSFNKQAINVSDSKVKISFKPLSKSETKRHTLGLILSGVFMAVFAAVFCVFNFVTGLGTGNNPFKIYSQAQLYQALNSGGNYVLANNLELSNFDGDVNFGGVLDGGGYTISINSLKTNQLILNNNGTIKNLNITYPAVTKQISTNFSLLAENNYGTISNVGVTCSNLSLNCQKEVNQVVSISGFANQNDGVVENCSILLNAQINGNGGGDGFVSGFVADNNGSVKNCVFNKLSTVVASETDVAGFVVNNNIDAVVDGCLNYAELTQNSSHNEWNPTLAGIALNNWGTVKNSVNNAKLTISSTNDNSNAQGTAFLGGIVAYNYSEIYSCKNNGNLKVTTQNIVAYCAGIFAHSTYWVTADNKTIMPAILNCGVECEIEVSTQHQNAFAFSGGLGGFLYGELKNCFSIVNFKTGYDEKKYYIGTALGSSYLEYWGNYICIEAQNNYVLVQNNVGFQIGSLVTNGQLTSYGLDTPASEVVTLESAESIKNLEVYYE